MDAHGGGEETPIMRRGQRVLRDEIRALQETRQLLGVSFESVVERILRSQGRVCVTGMGKAGLIGNKIQATFSSTGTAAYALHPAEALHGDLGMVGNNDVVLALSKSGGSEVALLLPLLKSLGCYIALITAERHSPAARVADDLLLISGSEEACPLQLAPSSSAVSMLALGDALAFAVMEQKGIQPEEYARFHPGGALGRSLLPAQEVMRTGDNCPRVLLDATAHDCFLAMQRAGSRAGAAAVVDQEGTVEGIITQGDLVRCLLHEQISASSSVRALMTKDPKCIFSSDPVREAVNLMNTYLIDEVLVVNKDRTLAGMIDIQDVVVRGFTVHAAR